MSNLLAKLPVVLVLSVSSVLACSTEKDHPPGPPVDEAGAGNPTPVSVEFGGTSNTGTRGGSSSSGDGVEVFAGSNSVGGDTSSFGGTTAGTSSASGNSGGRDGASGTSFGVAGNDSFGGTTSTSSAAGTFSSGGF